MKEPQSGACVGLGMRWIGYDAMRFSTQDSVDIEEKEYMFALN
jgi:hypothetical protein